ncbi:MAG: hypothetical protein R2932_13850 [Caldilineaceae bacterium]
MDNYPPYLEWQLDRWKIVILIVLFIFLLGGLLLFPDEIWTSASSQI